MSGQRQRTRLLDAAMADQFRDWTSSMATAYQAGYLEGAVRTAIIRLAYEDPAVVAAQLTEALETSERAHIALAKQGQSA